MKPVLLKLATAIVTFMLCLALGEIALCIFTPFRASEASNTIAQPDLGFEINPSLADIDDDGFHNPSGTRAKAEIAFIGDSHAYGYQVSSEDWFPSVVARKTGRNTYKFGVGGYRVYQYKAVLDLAAESSLKTFVLGFSHRNDLYTTCKKTQTEYWRKYGAEHSPAIRATLA